MNKYYVSSFLFKKIPTSYSAIHQGYRGTKDVMVSSILSFNTVGYNV